MIVSNPARDVCYYGFGRKWSIKHPALDCVDEAINSMTSLRKHNPDVKISFVGFLRDKRRVENHVDHFTEIDVVVKRYGKIGVRMRHEIDRGRFSWICGFKLCVLECSPFHETLYLDTDTTVFGDISPIWNFPDISVAKEEPAPEIGYGLNNAGVLFIRRTGTAMRWLEMWRRSWEVAIQKKNITDQCCMPAFRNVEYGQLDYRVWNVRPKNVEEALNSKQKPIILHSRFHPGVFNHLPDPVCKQGIGLI